MVRYLRGLHSEAIDQWIQCLNDNSDRILNEHLMSKRYAIVEELASGIKGIGPEVVLFTAASIEEYIGRGMPSEMNPFGICNASE